MKSLNMIGEPCPIPVVNAKKALEENGLDGVIVIVDNFVAVQNLEKMARGEGYGFSYTQDSPTQWTVTIPNKGGGVAGGTPALGGSGQAKLGSEGGTPPP